MIGHEMNKMCLGIVTYYTCITYITYGPPSPHKDYLSRIISLENVEVRL